MYKSVLWFGASAVSTLGRCACTCLSLLCIDALARGYICLLVVCPDPRMLFSVLFIGVCVCVCVRARVRVCVCVHARACAFQYFVLVCVSVFVRINVLHVCLLVVIDNACMCLLYIGWSVCLSVLCNGICVCVLFSRLC